MASKVNDDDEGAVGGNGDCIWIIELPLATALFVELAGECACANVADLDAVATLGNHDPVAQDEVARM
jgi:hypothetical protein